MNKRIQKLAKQAGFGLRRDGEIYTSRLEHLPITEDLAKFAELIVKECMKLNSKELSITAIERLLPLYAEHFGVEE